MAVDGHILPLTWKQPDMKLKTRTTKGRHKRELLLGKSIAANHHSNTIVTRGSLEIASFNPLEEVFPPTFTQRPYFQLLARSEKTPQNKST